MRNLFKASAALLICAALAGCYRQVVPVAVVPPAAVVAPMVVHPVYPPVIVHPVYPVLMHTYPIYRPRVVVYRSYSYGYRRYR